MCTVATWKNNGICMVTGRNMDWNTPMATKLWVLPAGAERVGIVDDKNALTWTSRYGSVVASTFDAAVADGLNEKGLSAHVLWLAESVYAAPDPKLPSLGLTAWAQYYLDNFATVAEAVKETRGKPYNLVPPADLSMLHGRAPTVHLVLNDAHGETAVLESIDGKLRIWHGKEYDVVTNSPTFDKQLQNIKKYDGFGGVEKLPGSTEADDRFVRTSYYLKRLQQPTDERAAIAGIISVLRSAAQPYSTPDPDRPNIAPTLWRTVSDHDNLLYLFESTDSPYLTWVKLGELHLKPGSQTLCFDIDGQKDASGDISKQFKPHNFFKFA